MEQEQRSSPAASRRTGTTSDALNPCWLTQGKVQLALIILSALDALIFLRWYIPIKLVRFFHWLGMDGLSDWSGEVTGLKARIIELHPELPAILELQEHGRSA